MNRPYSGKGTTGDEKAYACVDRLVPLQATVVPQPVVRLAEGDAGQEVGREAGVDGREALEQARVPGLGIVGGLGVDDLGGLLEDVVGALRPLLDDVVVDGALLGGLLRGHCDGWEGMKKRGI